MDKALRIIVREVLRKVRNMNEATTTGNVAGYQTPYAFSGEGDDEKKKKAIERTGYTIVENRWLQLKKDVTRSENKKILDGVRHVRNQLSEIEKYLNWYGRLKKEGNLTQEKYYKRSLHHMNKIKEQASRINTKIEELTSDED